MAPTHTVNLLETIRVAPPPSQVPCSLPLTAFDFFWLGFPPVERLFFYGPSEHSITSFPNTVHRLKESLSLALQHFYPLAGKLEQSPETGKPEIRFTDGDSVSFLVAETDADFDHLSANHPRNASSFYGFVPTLPVSNNSSPVLSFQVTGFPNRGLSVGVAIRHAVADGRSFVHFMKTWAELCRTNSENLTLTLTDPPFYDRSLLLARTDLEKAFAGGFLKYIAVDDEPSSTCDRPIETQFVRATFQLCRFDIQKLKQVASRTRTETQNPVFFSTFVVACAYTWFCCVRSRKVGEEQENVVFGFTADCRARLDPPLPAAYFGNCVICCFVEAKSSEILGGNGFNVAVEAINGAVKRLNEEPFRDAENLIRRILSTIPGRPISVAGSPKFDIYETNFGWGKPRKVEVVSIDRSGAISLAESGDGGLEIGVSLPANEMDQFVSLFVNGLKFPL